MRVNWKKVACLTALMGSCFAAGAWASDGIRQVEAYLRPDFHVVADGRQADLSMPPLIYEDRTYLPLKAIGELVGADVKWQDQTKTIYVNSRFAGQPEAPETGDELYEEIPLQQPFAYKVGYLGGEYALLTLTVNQETYFRAADLARMGVDTRGLMKSREAHTGYLFVKQEEVTPLWKQPPDFQIALEPVAAGVADEALKAALQEVAQQNIAALIQGGYGDFPSNAEIFFMEAIPGKPGWFALLGQGTGYDLIVFVVNMVQDDKGHWRSKSIQHIGYELLADYYK